VDKGWLKPEEIVEALEQQLGFPIVDLTKYEINPNVATLIPESIVRKYKLIAIDRKENRLIVAMVDPLNFFAIDDVKLYTKMDVTPCLATSMDLERVIEKYYTNVLTQKALDEFSDSFAPIEDEIDTEQEMLEVATAPIVKLINSIIEQAMRSKASDIHIEPSANDIRVRFRVDGDLNEIMVLPRSNLSAIVTRIKIIGKMDIAEKRIPQDGRVEMKFNDNEIDLRISSLPTVYGEKVVIRILDKSNFNFTKEGLGFSEGDLEKLNRMIAQPYGMMLVTGPTGSGKSTTLYTVLRELNVPSKNVITVEDPVEYKLKGINQVPGKPQGRFDICIRLKVNSQAGPGHHHDRGNKGCGNCGDCSQGSHNRPPGFINITYKRQPVYGSKTYRYGLGALFGILGHNRNHITEIGKSPMPQVQGEI